MSPSAKFFVGASAVPAAFTFANVKRMPAVSARISSVNVLVSSTMRKVRVFPTPTNPLPASRRVPLPSTRYSVNETSASPVFSISNPIAEAPASPSAANWTNGV